MYEGADTSETVSSNGPITVAGLRDVLDKVGNEDANVNVLVVSPDLDPIMDMTVVGLAEDSDSGNLVVLVFPGSVEEWRRA